MRRVALVAMFLTVQLLSAGEQTMAPERFGARVARVTDRAQIELLVDALRSQSGNGKAQEILKRAAGIAPTMQRWKSTAEGTRSTANGYHLTVDGMTARAEFDDDTHLLLEKQDGAWTVTGGTLTTQRPAGETERATDGASVGLTFVPVPFSRDHDVDRLTRTVTRERLDRQLFGRPERTASFYTVRYRTQAPFVEATYIQFVTDPGWNRLLYGNLNSWIKAVNDIRSPSGIASDPAGRVFVGEEGRTRIRVLRLEGTGQEARLVPSYTIDGIAAGIAIR